MKTKIGSLLVLALISGLIAMAQSTEPALPYSPSLDLTSLDKTVDPCANFYQYACGGWQKKNPIPSDEIGWDVYSKLTQDNANFLHGILEQAASNAGQRDTVTQEVGDFYAACMDQTAVDKRGLAAVQTQLDAIAALKSARDLAPLVARLQLVYGQSILFAAGSGQDLDNSEQVIAQLDQGGLGLPERDYYTKADAKSIEIRGRYVEHAQKIFVLLGETPAAAKQDAATLMRLETRLAKASQTEVERRDPYTMKHAMTVADLDRAAPNFDWKTFYSVSQYPAFEKLNVGSPDFLKEVNTLLASEPIANWKTYLRFHVANSASPFLSANFVDENFEFYRKYLRGAKTEQDRWKRCVSYVNHSLDDALSQVYVAKVFAPEVKARTLDMVQRIEAAMELRIKALDWMSPATKEQALVKLHGIRNKIGYPDKWRDYSSITIARDDFAGNMQRAAEFESHRQINKIGKPVDHGEWDFPATTVDADYDPQMNDINFPAGVLLPPLFDPKMDDAPNYGNTGGTVGHELTHAFDDEGSQFDATGNLKNWWTKEDREKFDARTKGVKDQYAQYVVVDDLHINSALTLGEDVADLGGEILAYMAWRDATKDKNLGLIDGLTQDQRFFIGYAQWACGNERPEQMRVHTMTDPHSPLKYRINGVVVNMPEFAQAFSCKLGSPMMKPADKIVKVW